MMLTDPSLIANLARAFAAASARGGTHWIAVVTVLICVLVGVGVAWRCRDRT